MNQTDTNAINNPTTHTLGIKPTSYLKSDIKSYENMQNSLNILKLIVQSENDIENNRVTSQEEMFNSLEKKHFSWLLKVI